MELQLDLTEEEVDWVEETGLASMLSHSLTAAVQGVAAARPAEPLLWLAEALGGLGQEEGRQAGQPATALYTCLVTSTHVSNNQQWERLTRKQELTG